MVNKILRIELENLENRIFVKLGNWLKNIDKMNADLL